MSDMDSGDQSRSSKSETVQAGKALWAFIRETWSSLRGFGLKAFSFGSSFLENKQPSVIFITAFGVFILASLIAQLALVFVPGAKEVMHTVHHGRSWTTTEPTGSIQLVEFFSACSYFTRIAAMMLAVWGLIRLLADAIENRAKS